MDVTGFLCVSLGSSTVQIHDSLGTGCTCTCSEAGFISQNGDHAVECNTKEQNSVVHFLWATVKKCFLFTVGKCLSRKAVHNWVEKFSHGCLKVVDDAQPGRPLETATQANVQVGGIIDSS
jgi:hypothetical protein